MVNFGIIGLGTEWESRYSPALQKFRGRIAVRAIFDPIVSRARQAADVWGAVADFGIVSLLQRHDIKAVLLLEPGWYGLESLRLICQHRRPAYVAGGLGDDLPRLNELWAAGQSEGLTVMPELGLRYEPSTGRLQELIATQLGQPQRIVVTVPHQSLRPGDILSDQVHIDTGMLGKLVDWCRYVFGSSAESVQMTSRHESVGGSLDYDVKVAYQGATAAGVSQIAEILYRGRGALNDPAQFADREQISFHVECERGVAEINGATDISWTAESSPKRESLTGDRASVEVMLDQFCRRVVGGLIPVADIGDLCGALEVALAAKESLRVGEQINLSAAD